MIGDEIKSDAMCVENPEMERRCLQCPKNAIKVQHAAQKVMRGKF